MKRQYEDKIQNWINTVQYQGRNFKDDADMPVFRNSNAAFFYIIRISMRRIRQIPVRFSPG